MWAVRRTSKETVLAAMQISVLSICGERASDGQMQVITLYRYEIVGETKENRKEGMAIRLREMNAGCLWLACI